MPRYKKTRHIKRMEYVRAWAKKNKERLAKEVR